VSYKGLNLWGFGVYLNNGLTYSAQTLQSGRYYGSAFFASDGFTKGRIGTAWKTGKVYAFLFGFLTVDFVLALHAAAERL